MKIINIVPGFGGTFYCGNCLRDSGYVQSLKKAGHEAHTLPIYLPLSGESCNREDMLPVFYGAVNIYLKQNFKLLRHMPKWMERFFNSDFILAFAAKKAGSTRAAGLEDMTISMLKGHEGYQKEELEHLIDYLKNHEKPDIIHLSNALLLGLAHKIKSDLNIPVVCSLQDEDVWIDAMRSSYNTKLWDLMSEKGKEVDAFIAVSEYFAGVMKEKMKLTDNQLYTVHIGVEPEFYEYNEPKQDPQAIGYLSRLNKENGLEILVDAFIQLKKKKPFEKLQLKLTGGSTGDDKRFINKQIRKLKRNNCLQYVEFLKDFTGDSLKYFFRNITVLSVPVLKGEAFGLYQLESLASGIPIVQPDEGAFAEIVKQTGGGAIYQPNTPGALAEKLATILENKEELIKMSQNGRNAINDKFSSEVLTNKMISVFSEIIKKND